MDERTFWPQNLLISELIEQFYLIKTRKEQNNKFDSSTKTTFYIISSPVKIKMTIKQFDVKNRFDTRHSVAD